MKKDMQELMNDAFVGIKESGFIEDAIKKQVEETIKESIKDTFRSYSDFGKSFKESIEKEIKIDFSELSLGSYSATITTMIRGLLKEKLETEAFTSVNKFLKDLDSNDIPEEMKITSIVQKIVEFWKEHDSDLKEGFEFSFHFVQKYPDSDSVSHLYWIYLDKEEGKEPYECDIEIQYDSKDQEFDDITVSKKSMKENTFYTSRSWQLEGLLFQIYSAKTKVINDAEDVETYVSSEYDY